MEPSTDQFLIFIVEDDRWYAEFLKYHLSLNPDYQVETFLTGKDMLAELHRNPGAITLDYSLPDMTGQELLKKIKDENPDMPVVMISGQEDVKVAISLLKLGAYDYIVKDDDVKDRIWNIIKNIRERHELKEEITNLREEVKGKYDFGKIIKGNSPQIKKIFKLLEKAISTNITVSVTGETGTGKELVAKAVHFNSKRRGKPFVPVNVTAIPKELIESELFGYEKGAFTGANARKIGKFEEAHKGTLFLDEIGDMDLNMQAKLLRVLQEREVNRIGGNETIKIDVKLIVATHKNLADEVKKGNFREDLYYRLLGLPIELPPLRDREKDILILAKFFVDEFAKENQMNKISLTKEAQNKLLGYPWPGNIRELKAVMELSAVLSEGGEIDADDITFNTTGNMTDFMLEETTLKEYTQRIIKHFLDKYDRDVIKVAQKLDIGKSTIYRMIKAGEIE